MESKNVKERHKFKTWEYKPRKSRREKPLAMKPHFSSNLNKGINEINKVIEIDSENEGEEFTNNCLKWKFGGGVKIGSTFFYDKKTVPSAIFNETKLKLELKTDEALKTNIIEIDYCDIENISFFLRKCGLRGCFRFCLSKPMKTSFVKNSDDNKKIELYFNEYAKMFETGFIERLKFIPVINHFLFKSGKTIHKYNTRATKDRRFKGKIAEGKEVNEMLTVITYPRSGDNLVTVTKKDIAFLQPCRMLNDSIMDFYLRYLFENHKESFKEKKVHFFNTFFYKMLEDSPGNIVSWTKKIETFKMDFILIPVNEGMHWKATMVCYPKNSVVKQSSWRKATHYPRLVSMDSVRGNRRIQKSSQLIRNFLSEEYLRKFGKKFEFTKANLPALEMTLSKQINSFDCGLYLLEYVERFCKNPFENTQNKMTLGSYRFSPGHIKEKRKVILDLIRRICSSNQN